MFKLLQIWAAGCFPFPAPIQKHCVLCEHFCKATPQQRRDWKGLCRASKWPIFHLEKHKPIICYSVFPNDNNLCLLGFIFYPTNLILFHFLFGGLGCSMLTCICFSHLAVGTKRFVQHVLLHLCFTLPVWEPSVLFCFLINRLVAPSIVSYQQVKENVQKGQRSWEASCTRLMQIQGGADERYNLSHLRKSWKRTFVNPQTNLFCELKAARHFAHTPTHPPMNMHTCHESAVSGGLLLEAKLLHLF